MIYLVVMHSNVHRGEAGSGEAAEPGLRDPLKPGTDAEVHAQSLCIPFVETKQRHLDYGGRGI